MQADWNVFRRRRREVLRSELGQEVMELDDNAKTSVCCSGDVVGCEVWCCVVLCCFLFSWLRCADQGYGRGLGGGRIMTW